MRSSIELQESSQTNYYRLYKSDNGFEAEIIMNPRDAMVFAQVKKLPESQTDAIVALNDFLSIFTSDYGAKATLHIAPALLKQLPEGTLKSNKGVGRYISKEDSKGAIEKVREKKHVALQLNKFETGEYRLLTKNDLRSRIAELSEFKIKYSSFANKDKILNGQYSEKAEEEKLNNPFVEHYAIEHNGKIIACVMHVLHGDKSYDADFVVHPAYRSQNIHPTKLLEEEQFYPHGLAQALCVKVYDHSLAIHHHLTGLWFIAGGYGAKDVGGHLYDEVFPTKAIQGDTGLQNTVGIFLMFDAPGRELLLAGNRDLNTKLVNDNERKYVDVALGILEQSEEPDLAAKQPKVITAPKKEQVVSISVFTNPDKTPNAVATEPKTTVELNTGGKL